MSDHDWTQADYVIIGDKRFASKLPTLDDRHWTSPALVGIFSDEELAQYAEGRGVPILPARLVTEDEWAAQRADHLNDVADAIERAERAEAEVERLCTVVARVSAAWTDQGISPSYHRRCKSWVWANWPTLATRVAALAGEIDHGE